MRSSVFVAVIASGACSSPPATPPAAIRFLHTFNPSETELFNTTIADRGLVVDASLVPFARGHQVITEILRAGVNCPDLIRIDATWLPGLVAQKLVVAPPAELQRGPWMAMAAELATLDGVMWAVPQTVDGLVVVRETASAAPRTASIDDLVAAARAASHPQGAGSGSIASAGEAGNLPHPLGVRVDGYWLVPWLRAEGAELAPGSIAADGATRGLAKFGALFGDLAPAPPSAGSEAPDELRRWTAREVAYWVTGPWLLASLRDRETIAISALAHAPRGGQLLVVPVCAKRPADGWRLAAELTSEPVELVFSDAFATVPTRASAQPKATPLVQQIAAALVSAEMLPRSPLTPLLFDDLNPALAAVVAGDATADEAMAGVRRGWQRLEGQP